MPPMGGRLWLGPYVRPSLRHYICCHACHASPLPRCACVCVHVAIKAICKGDVDPAPPAGNVGGNAMLPVDNPFPADPPPPPPAPAVPPPGL